MAEVDIFSPFRRRSEGHEDRLTWGFLVALKYVPELQRYFRDLVLQRVPADRRPPSRASWEPAAITTQTSQIGTSASFVVSVLLSDASLDASVLVEKSDRGARYDGVIEYSDGVVLILENKPWSGAVWTGQLSPSIASFEGLPDDVDLFEHAVCLEWGEVLEGILTYSGSRVASYAERGVAGDFLSVVEELHPVLSPYRTFELCGTRREALAKRIEGLSHAIASDLGCEVRKRPSGAPYIQLPNEVVQQVHLQSPEGSDDGGPSLRLSIWPGDTVRQARAFLEKVDQAAFLALPEAGWQVLANLHFSHMQKHLVWASTSMEVSEYLAYFASTPEEIGRKRLEDISLGDLTDRWADLGLLSRADIDELKREFLETNRSFLNVIPGFQLHREWPMSRILELESCGGLDAELIESLAVPLATWGERLPASVSA